MKKALITLSLLLCLTAFAATPAYAQTSRLYYAGYLGLNINKTEDMKNPPASVAGDYTSDNAISFASALGVRINRNWRVEGELSYRKHTLSRATYAGAGTFQLGGDIQSTLYLMNLYHDFDYRWRNLQPYVSLGFGAASHRVNFLDNSGLAPNATDNSFNFAWQIGSGVKYRLRDNLAFTGNYRYLDTSAIQIHDYTLGYGGHEFRLGVEYDIPVSTVRNFLKP